MLVIVLGLELLLFLSAVCASAGARPNDSGGGSHKALGGGHQLRSRRRSIPHPDSLQAKRDLIAKRSYSHENAGSTDINTAIARNQVNPHKAAGEWGKSKKKRQQASLTPTVAPTTTVVTVGTSYVLSTSTSLSYQLSTSLSTSLLQSVSTSLSTQIATTTRFSTSFSTSFTTVTNCLLFVCNTVTSTRSVPVATATITGTTAVATSTILNTLVTGTSVATRTLTVGTVTALATSTIGTNYQLSTITPQATGSASGCPACGEGLIAVRLGLYPLLCACVAAL